MKPGLNGVTIVQRKKQVLVKKQIPSRKRKKQRKAPKNRKRPSKGRWTEEENGEEAAAEKGQKMRR